MNDNTVLPIRFFLKEQYKELKDNREFTGVNTFTGEEETVPDIPQALNCVADTTEQDIAKVQQEIAELKEQVATLGSKVYLHKINLTRANDTDTILAFPLYSTKETPISSIQELLPYVYFQTGYIYGSHFGLCSLMTGVSGLRVVGSGFEYYDFDWTIENYSIYEV